MKGDFHEDLLSESRDRTDAADQDFDWQRLYSRLNEEASSPDIDRKLAETITRLLQLLLPDEEGQVRPQSVGLRVIALARVLNPAYFEGSPSLTELARRCNVTPAALARHTGAYSRLIQWRNRAQRHAWNWRQE